MVGESAQEDNHPLHVVAERRNTSSVSRHELQILGDTQLQLSSTRNGSPVHEGLRLREGTNEVCRLRTLYSPGFLKTI
jgi:hypothetical protein